MNSQPARQDPAQANEPGTTRDSRYSSTLVVPALLESLTDIVVGNYCIGGRGCRGCRSCGRKRRRESVSKLPVELSPSPDKKCNSEQKPGHKKGTFMCSVCLLTAQEICKGANHMVATKCGHVFCNTCIDNCFKKNQVCPTCKRQRSKKDIIRLYL